MVATRLRSIQNKIKLEGKFSRRAAEKSNVVSSADYLINFSVPRSATRLGHPFSLAWVDISGSHFRLPKYDVVSFVGCVKL